MMNFNPDYPLLQTDSSTPAPPDQPLQPASVHKIPVALYKPHPEQGPGHASSASKTGDDTDTLNSR